MYKENYLLCKSLYENPVFINLAQNLNLERNKKNYDLLKEYTSQYKDFIIVLFDRTNKAFFDSKLNFNDELLKLTRNIINVNYAFTYLYYQPKCEQISSKGLYKTMIKNGYGYSSGKRIIEYNDEKIYYHVSKAYSKDDTLSNVFVFNVIKA